ncbi:3-dehydroquinate synthase family protein [Cellulomonas sp. URHB0016]
MLRQEIPLDGTDVPYLYGVDVTRELVAALVDLVPGADLVVLVHDAAVAEHAAPVVEELRRRVPVTTIAVEAGEPRKTLSLVESIVDHAVAHHATRRTVVAGMGGGMVGNVAGLAASLLFRGIRLVHLPTTPVAAFDSVLSVKQAVNLSAGKNLAGAYHAPTLIACDLRWLTSVPHGQLLTGAAEMAKNVLAVVPERQPGLRRALDRLRDEPTAALLELLDIGCAAKRPYLASDPRERREALIFEYGHTVGHALEFLSGGRTTHGEAVAWGMLVAAEVSQALGHLADDDVERHYDVVSWLQLDPAPAWAVGFDPDRVRAVLATDNKRGYVRTSRDTVPMVLLEALGRPLADEHGRPLVPVPVDVVMSALDTVAAGSAVMPIVAGPVVAGPVTADTAGTTRPAAGS